MTNRSQSQRKCAHRHKAWGATELEAEATASRLKDTASSRSEQERRRDALYAMLSPLTQ